jgi:Tol biopolymer transport system component
MNDERLFERLGSHDGPAALDSAFEDRLFSILEREMRRGRSLRPALLLAATLLLVLTITAALAVGSGLIKLPWLNRLPVPTTTAPNGLIAYPLGDENDPLAAVADIYLTSMDGTPRRIIGFPGDGVYQTCPAFSPDGALLAYREGAEGRDPPTSAAVIIVALDRNGTPAPRLRIDAGAAVSCPKWSPDGRAVAYTAGDHPELWVAPLAGSATSYGPLPCEPGVGCPTGFAWTRDSSALVFAHSEALRLVPLDGADAPRILARGAVDGDLREFFEGISASPVGGLVAIGGGVMREAGDGSGSQESAFVRVVNMDSAEVIWEQSWNGGSTYAPVWSPDGTRIAWTNEDELFVHEINDSPPVGRVNQWALEGAQSPVGMASGVVWSPDGRRLLFVGYSDDPRAYAIVSIAVDGPPDLRTLTPWTMGLYNARVDDLGWQAEDQ